MARALRPDAVTNKLSLLPLMPIWNENPDEETYVHAYVITYIRKETSLAVTQYVSWPRRHGMVERWDSESFLVCASTGQVKGFLPHSPTDQSRHKKWFSIDF